MSKNNPANFDEKLKTLWEALRNDIENLSKSSLGNETQNQKIETMFAALDSLKEKNLEPDRFLLTDSKKINEFQRDLKNLRKELKALPYSDSEIINKVYKSINRLLEALANFFMTGPIIGEGVVIHPKRAPYQCHFFSPARASIQAVDGVLAILRPSS